MSAVLTFMGQAFMAVLLLFFIVVLLVATAVVLSLIVGVVRNLRGRDRSVPRHRNQNAPPRSPRPPPPPAPPPPARASADVNVAVKSAPYLPLDKTAFVLTMANVLQAELLIDAAQAEREARRRLNQFLKDCGIAFGASDYDWSAKGARDLVFEVFSDG